MNGRKAFPWFPLDPETPHRMTLRRRDSNDRSPVTFTKQLDTPKYRGAVAKSGCRLQQQPVDFALLVLIPTPRVQARVKRSGCIGGQFGWTQPWNQRPRVPRDRANLRVSVDTSISQIPGTSWAGLMLHTISGSDPSRRMFLPGRRFDPPRAAITARILKSIHPLDVPAQTNNHPGAPRPTRAHALDRRLPAPTFAAND